MNGIEYKNAEADFSKCAEATVSIENMTSNRSDNFQQADVKCAEQWNAAGKDGKTDWTANGVRECVGKTSAHGMSDAIRIQWT